jgi:hypothetical protein
MRDVSVVPRSGISPDKIHLALGADGDGLYSSIDTAVRWNDTRNRLGCSMPWSSARSSSAGRVRALSSSMMIWGGRERASKAAFGFQRLVAEVGLGHVGLVLGVEISRLARSCRDYCCLVATSIQPLRVNSIAPHGPRYCGRVRATLVTVIIGIIRSVDARWRY